MKDETSELIMKVQKLEKENSLLKQIIKIGRSVYSEKTSDSIIHLIASKVPQLLEVEHCALFLFNSSHTSLWTSFCEKQNSHIKTVNQFGIAGLCGYYRKIINVPNAYDDPRFNSKIDDITGYKTRNIMSVPVISKNSEIISVLQLINSKSGQFTQTDEEKTLEYIASISNLDFKYKIDNAFASILKLLKSIRCKRGIFYILDKNRGKLELYIINDDTQKINLTFNVGAIALCSLTGQSINIKDAGKDSRFNVDTDNIFKCTAKSTLCVPVINQTEELLGVVQLLNKKNDVFTCSDIQLLDILCVHIAQALDNSSDFSKQQKQFKSILKAIALSVDSLDTFTTDHSQNVNKFAMGIARILGLKEAEIDIISVAALLHNCGNAGIDRSIKTKPSELTQKEYEHVKKHVMYTYDFLRNVSFVDEYQDVPLITLCHHENLDGSGYLEGRMSGDIPFSSKIIAVADAFEALMSRRHYRDAFTPEVAFEIMEQEAGKKYDLNIINALKKYWYNR